MTDYASHIDTLARQWGVTVNDTMPHALKSHAHPADRKICIVPVVDAFTYAIALHELGHIVAPNGAVRMFIKTADPVHEEDLSIAEEDAAWEWAESVSLPWTEDMQAAKDIGLATHHAQRDEVRRRAA